MKLRTSFFNPTLYKKDITRFAPLWILYTVVMMLIMLPLMNVGWNNSVLDRAMYRVDVLAETIGAMSVMNLLYGVLAAQLLFGELFNTRLCNALHAMPIRREARFGSHLAAGFSFSIVPNLLISVLMMQDMGSWWYAPLLWCGALTLQYLFFFGVAVLSMHCTGNRFAAVLVYAIVNFASMAALWFANVIFVPLMKGVILEATGFMLFSPVVMLCTMNDFFSVNVSPNFHTFEMGTQWPVLWIYAAAGVVALVGALLIYRRRALESAGDFMAVKWLRPIFLLIYTLCVGAFFAVFGSIFSGDTYVTFLIVGFAVGFFTGKMLLERTVRIFNLKSLLQLVILIVLMWLSLQAVQFDLFGIVRYVPKAEAVKEAQVVVYFYGRNKLTVSDPREMEILVNAHALALEEDGCKHGDQHIYEITYSMKDGRTVKRRYTLCRVEKAAATFEKLFDSPKAIFGYEGHWDDFTRSVTSIKVTGLARQKFLNAEDWLNFLECLYADCENGKMGVREDKTNGYEITIQAGDKTVFLQIYDDSLAYGWLQSYEKRDMQDYLKKITAITLDKEKIDPSQYEALVSALYADAKEHYHDGWDVFEQLSWDASFHLVVRFEEDAPEEIIPIGEYARNTYDWIKSYLYETEQLG